MKKAELSLSGFLVSLIIIAMFATVFTVFITGLEEEYGVTGEHSLAKYNVTAAIIEDTEEIRDATKIEQQEGLLDVIGGYFSAGYSALKISLSSFGLFEEMMDDAAEDIEFMEKFKFKDFLIAIVLILIFVGVIIAVLVKMRI